LLAKLGRVLKDASKAFENASPKRFGEGGFSMKSIVENAPHAFSCVGSDPDGDGKPFPALRSRLTSGGRSVSSPLTTTALAAVASHFLLLTRQLLKQSPLS